MRVEKDSIGTKEIDDEKYYGIHTLRALENFDIKNTKRVNSELIKSITLVKAAAATTNNKIKKLSDEKKNAILDAVEKIINELYLNKVLFPLPAIQGGAGTSTNMNVNEVIANLGLEYMGKNKGEYEFLDPIEDINLSQSTNDVYPTAVKITIIRLLKELVEEVKNLQEELQKKEDEFATIKKIGRTQLQDAVKITLGQEFGAYGEVISRDRWRLYKIEERIRMVNIGGTAIGTGIASSIEYRAQITSEIQRITGLGIARAENLIDSTQNLDVFVEVSGLLKTLA
ncbi:MAG: lyase family protein, partial [Leptotrichiaceae bacterium]